MFVHGILQIIDNQLHSVFCGINRGVSNKIYVEQVYIYSVVCNAKN